MSLTLAAAAALTLSACGGSGGDYYDDGYYAPAIDMYYIDDEFGDGVEGIEYHCISGEQGFTDIDGGFYFDTYSDTCTFEELDWVGFDLYVDYASGNGVPFVKYECGPPPVVVGETGSDGFFFDSYSYDEYCTLYL